MCVFSVGELILLMGRFHLMSLDRSINCKIQICETIYITEHTTVSLDSTLLLMFIGSFYQTFLVLAYHFVYRYKSVSGYYSHF